MRTQGMNQCNYWAEPLHVLHMNVCAKAFCILIGTEFVVLQLNFCAMASCILIGTEFVVLQLNLLFYNILIGTEFVVLQLNKMIKAHVTQTI